jgi:general secretion pathway protein D
MIIHIAKIILVAVVLSPLCATAGQLEPASAPTISSGSAPTRKLAGAGVYDGADIGPVANEVLGQIVRMRFAIDPAITGKVSFRYNRTARPQDILAAFELALAVVDVALVRARDQYLIVPRQKARAVAAVQTLASANVALAPGYQILSVPINNASADQVAKALSANGLSDAVIGSDEKASRIVIAGGSRELRAALALIRQNDRPRLDPSLSRVFTLTNSNAAVVAAELDRLLTGFDVSGITVVTLPRLNQLVVGVRNAGQMAEVERWIARLDVPGSEEGATVWRYKPRNLSAGSLADALTQLASSGDERAAPAQITASQVPPGGEAAKTSTGGPLLDKDFRIGVEKESNTLLVAAPAARWKPLRVLLDELDVAPGQVMVEATVLEVTLNKTFRMGVDWSIVGSGNWSALLSRSSNGAVVPTLPGAAVTYLSGDVRAVVDALSTRTHVEVVSAPRLLAVDNQQAVLQVGDQVPIVNQTSRGTTSGDAPIVSVTEYRDTGVILKIKPRINGDDTVTLDFSQEVSGVIRNTVSNIDSPTIQQRRFQSQILLHEGQTAALGGLMSSKGERGGSGVPGLNQIPGLGALFGARTRGSDRTEIIVLLSARIVRNAEDGAAVTSALRTQLPTLNADVPAAR